MDKLKRMESLEKQCHKVTKSNDIIQKAKNGMTLQEQKKFCVYRYLDKFENVIYVGITEQELYKRIAQHKSDLNGLSSYANKIEYAFVPTKAEMIIREIYYINKYKPRFNVKDKFADTFTMELPNLTWELYIDTKVKSIRNIKHHKKTEDVATIKEAMNNLNVDEKKLINYFLSTKKDTTDIEFSILEFTKLLGNKYFNELEIRRFLKQLYDKKSFSTNSSKTTHFLCDYKYNPSTGYIYMNFSEDFCEFFNKQV